MGNLAEDFKMEKIPEETLKIRRRIGRKFLIVLILIICSWVILFQLDKHYNLEQYGVPMGLWIFLGIIIIIIYGLSIMMKIGKTLSQRESMLKETYGYGGYIHVFIGGTVCLIMGFVVRNQNQTGSTIFFVLALVMFGLGLIQFKDAKKKRKSLHQKK